MSDFDVAVIGAGIAGAGLAAALAPHARVVILEAEAQPGYHATGRSAAFWAETYGGPFVQPLTTASGPALRAGGFVAPLGSIKLGRAEDAEAIDAFLEAFAGTGVQLERIDPHAALPGLRPDWVFGVAEPGCDYIDVAALHASFLATARRHRAGLRTDSPLIAAKREGAAWRLETPGAAFTADVIANAAGAWADEVAGIAGVAPIGITPYRRTMVQLRTDPPAPRGLPHVSHIAGSFYFKPEGTDRLWLSPHDEIPDRPGDVQPEEIDVAIAIDRFEGVVDWRVLGIDRKWAGLRSFARDRLPVYGFDTRAPGFFWCAGQGGFGIQTAPAASQLAAALLLGHALPDELALLDAERYAPGRFAD